MRTKQEPIIKLYVGRVVDNADPEGRGRVRAIVVEVMGEVPLEWASPVGVQMAGPLRGLFAPPEVGSNVTIGFQKGNIHAPLYWCGPWSAPKGVSEIPTDMQGQGGVEPTTIGFETRRYLFKLLDAAGGSGGLTIKDKETLAAFSIGSDGAIQMLGPEGRSVLLSPSGDLIQITDGSREILIDNAGIKITDQGGQSIFLDGSKILITDAAGQTFELDGTSTITLDPLAATGLIKLIAGASEFLVKGTAFFALHNANVVAYNAHTHGASVPIPVAVMAPMVSPTHISTQVATG